MFRSEFLQSCPSVCKCSWAAGTNSADCSYRSLQKIPDDFRTELQVRLLDSLRNKRNLEIKCKLCQKLDIYSCSEGAWQIEVGDYCKHLEIVPMYVDIFYDKQWGGTVAGSKRTIYLRAGLCYGRCLRLILKIQGYRNHEVTDRGGLVSFYVTLSCLMPHVTDIAAGTGGGR